MGRFISGFPLIKVEYLDIRDHKNLDKINKINGKVVIAGAVRVGKTRLIDNILV